MHNKPDVLIVGGSIAGCIAALDYANNGVSVTIVDKKSTSASTYKKLCTHFIQPSALPVLKKLKLDKLIEAAGGLPNKADIWTPGGWVRSDKPYSSNPDLAHGYNIERRILDPLLRNVVQNQPLINFRSGLELKKVHTENSNHTNDKTFEFEDEAGKKIELGAALTVAADGRFSKMASLLSNPEIVHANSRFACFAYFENVPLSSKDHSQFWMVNNNMAFAYPLSNNRTLICLFIVKTAFPEWKNNLEQHYLSFIQSLADAPSLANGTKVSPIYKMMDMPNIFRQPVFQNIAFIGDAAMALDPMSGVGCAFAIQSAAWLVEYTAGPLKNKMPMDEPLLQYENCHKELMTPHATGICADSLAKPMEEDRAAFYQEISNDADLTESFLALTGRIITPHNFHTAYFKKRFKIKPATI